MREFCHFYFLFSHNVLHILNKSRRLLRRGCKASTQHLLNSPQTLCTLNQLTLIHQRVPLPHILTSVTLISWHPLTRPFSALGLILSVINGQYVLRVIGEQLLGESRPDRTPVPVCIIQRDYMVNIQVTSKRVSIARVGLTTARSRRCILRFGLRRRELQS